MESTWKRLIKDLSERISDIIPGKGIYVLDLTARSSSPAFEWYSRGKQLVFYGVDSSVVKPFRIGVKYISFVSAAVVQTKVGSAPQAVVEEVFVDPVWVPDEGDISQFKAELTLKMFSKELEALRIARSLASKNDIVLLDGPLIDPPGMLTRLSHHGELSEKARKIVEARAYILGELWKMGVTVIGFVKRLQGSIFRDAFLGEKADSYRGEAGDRLIGFAIASIMKEKADEYYICKKGGKILVVTRPVEVTPDWAPDVDTYIKSIKNILGEDAGFFTSLYVPMYCDGNRRRPARIEFLSRPGTETENAIKVASLLEATIIPGYFIPLPVLIAHESCTIRRKEGRKLLRESASKYVADVLASRLPPLFELFQE